MHTTNQTVNVCIRSHFSLAGPVQNSNVAMGLGSASESDVHQELRHRAQLLAGAIAQQWKGSCTGKAVTFNTPELAVPCNVSERRTCIANERVIAAYRAF